MRTKFWQNYFLGKGFAKTSAHLFLNSDVANGKGGVWGGIFHLLLFLFWRNSGRTENRKYKFDMVSDIDYLFSVRDYGVHPRHPPRTFPLGLLAPRCLGLARFLALPLCGAGARAPCCLGEGRNPSPSFASSRQGSTNRLSQPLFSFSYPSFSQVYIFFLAYYVGAHP